MNSTFRILFYARWQKRKANGKVPIIARITINGAKSQFNLKIDVSEKIWDPKSGRAIGNSKEAIEANRYLNTAYGSLVQKYRILAERGEVVTASLLKDSFLGADIKKMTLLDAFKEFNDIHVSDIVEGYETVEVKR